MRASSGALFMAMLLCAPLLVTAQEPDATVPATPPVADTKAPAAKSEKPAPTPAAADKPATQDKAAAPDKPADKSAAKKSAAGKANPADASDEEEPPPKKAPKRFVPTEKGKADEDIPFPVDI